jgi:hypothetical protein
MLDAAQKHQRRIIRRNVDGMLLAELVRSGQRCIRNLCFNICERFVLGGWRATEAAWRKGKHVHSSRSVDSLHSLFSD